MGAEVKSLGNGMGGCGFDLQKAHSQENAHQVIFVSVVPWKDSTAPLPGRGSISIRPVER